MKKPGKVDYRIDMNGKVKTFHANLLKLYFDRDDCGVDAGILGIANVAMVDVQEDDVIDDSCLLNSSFQAQKEKPSDGVVSNDVTVNECKQIKTLIAEYSDVLSDMPGCTTFDEHRIKLTGDQPVRSKPYSLPFTSCETACEEVRNMITSGVIEQSNSPYCSIVIVKKNDGSNRFCIDFRAIDKITVFDAETIPNADDVFVQLAGCKYVSKFDLCKGYWQLPLEKAAREITAFQTPLNLYQFMVMPFGLVYASASFTRLMRK